MPASEQSEAIEYVEDVLDGEEDVSTLVLLRDIGFILIGITGLLMAPTGLSNQLPSWLDILASANW
ncbi:MAG: hypothetical protein R2873_13045 [Caldilineaceae bacterium]